MSRSYRKPWCKDQANKWVKRQASKKVRKYKNLSGGNVYKKVFCSYDISDWKWYDNSSNWFNKNPWKVNRK